MPDSPFPVSPAWLRARLVDGFAEWRRAMPALVAMPLLLLGIEAALAVLAHAPFRLTYWDVPLALSSLLAFTASIAGFWDGFLLCLGLLYRITDRAGWTRRALPHALTLWRRYGFFSLGLWPWVLLIVTGYGILMSSNVTELNLTLIERGVTAWRDGFFWSFEAPLIRAVTQAHYALGAIDVLYVMCWVIQVVALLALMLASRSLTWITGFCVSYMLMYFLGRWIGCLMPMLGPVFYQPELYTYLKGTLTQKQVDLMWQLIHHTDNGMTRTGILKGGLSAMPSLHVAMVSLCGWWIVARFRRALLPVILWVLATWYTTVGLGWHYASDGLGGVALMFATVWLTRHYLKAWGLPMPGARVSPSAPDQTIPYSARH